MLYLVTISILSSPQSDTQGGGCNLETSKILIHQSFLKLHIVPKLDQLCFMAASKVGVFSTRSPHRPNAIGLSLARVERIAGDTLHLLGADLVDGVCWGWRIATGEKNFRFDHLNSHLSSFVCGEIVM